MGAGAMLPVGRRARVEVPATSANIGPGFDCLGLALAMTDLVEAEVLAEGIEVEVSGEGAGQVPLDERHLVVRVLREALEDLGHEAPGLRLVATNVVPHSRGLGSSAAAIVAGLALAWGLARPGQELDLDWACQRSSELEGHPDNACAAVLGGIVLAHMDDGGGDGNGRPPVQVARLEPAEGLQCIVWVPGIEVPTAGARAVLPEAVAWDEAVTQAGSAALLVHALTTDPSRLLRGTRDVLHQDRRAALMPDSARLMTELRARGVPAVVSGAGPTVLAIGLADQLAAHEDVEQSGFVRHHLPLGPGVRLV